MARSLPASNRHVPVKNLGLRLSVTLAAFLVVASMGCGASSTTLLSPSPLGNRCGVTLDLSTSSIGSAGGSGTVRIQTDRECAWSLPSQPPWLKLSQPQTTQGPAEISFVVEENRSTSLRSWELVIADQRALISQEAALCTWSISPAKISVDAAGGEAQAILATEEFCTWELPKAASWITMTPDRGRGQTEITVHVSRNNGSNRTEKVSVSTAVIEVAQREAPAPTVPSPAPPPATPPKPAPQPPPAPPIPPVVQDTPAPCIFVVEKIQFTDVIADGSSVRVDVKTEAGCTWTSQSGVDWLSVPSETKTGPGRVDVRVLANSGPARSATVIVAGQNVTVEQRAALICSVSFAPALVSVTASGGVVSVSLSTPAGCAWSMTGIPNWINVSPASGNGAATLKVTATPNSGAARTAMLMVGGQVLRVEQAQLPSCTYTITPDRVAVSRKKQDVKIEIATLSHCEWSATSSASWARVTSGVRTASGTLQVKVDDNSRSPSRSAVVTVTGQNFSKEVTITQWGDDD